MEAERKSLDERMRDAAAKEKEVTLTELTGKSERELSQMTDKQMEKIMEGALEKLQDSAEKNHEVTKLTVMDKDGQKHVVKVVPAELDSPEANAVNDGRDGSNTYLDGKQTTMSDVMKKLGKKGVQALQKTVKAYAQAVGKGIEKAINEYGR